MKKIEIPFPIYEGLEVKNATVDVENGVTVVEYGEKELKLRRGDIIFASDHNGRNEAIFIYKKYIPIRSNGYLYISKLNTIENRLFFEDCLASSWKELRLATPSEQQLLFDALAKEGKRWNAEKLCIEEIETREQTLQEEVDKLHKALNDLIGLCELPIEKLTKIKSYLK